MNTTKQNETLAPATRRKAQSQEDNNPQCLYKVLERQLGVVEKYYVFDVNKLQIVQITRGDFSRRKGKHIIIGDNKIVVKGNNSGILTSMKSTFMKNCLNIPRFISCHQDGYESQGLFEKFNHIHKKFKLVMSGIEGIFSTLALFGEVNESVKWTASVIGTSSIFESLENDYMKIAMINIFKFILEIKSIFTGRFSIDNLARILVDFYQMYLICIKNKLVPSKSFFNVFSPQSGGMVSYLALTAFLPSGAKTLLKNLTILTSKKILDDSAFLVSVFGIVAKLFDLILEWSPPCVKAVLKPLFDILGIKEYSLINRARLVLCSYRKSKSIMLEASFRSEVNNVKSELDSIEVRTHFSKRASLSDFYAEFTGLYKCVKSYEENSRVEPVMFVLEGPAGVRKSVSTNKLVEALKSTGLTCYSHMIKAVDDGKDFYDDYAGQDVFQMDDVGASGVSQWRPFINFVSSIKLPLDCAIAENKNMKYFSSDTIILSTNKFSTLSNFKDKDCITCPNALFRRGYVFDFSQAKVVDNVLTGRIAFKHYDLRSSVFVNSFPLEFTSFCKKVGLTQTNPYIHIQGDNYIAWMAKIVLIWREVKLEHQTSNVLDPTISTELKDFKKQLGLRFKPTSYDIALNGESVHYHKQGKEKIVTSGYSVIDEIVDMSYEDKSEFDSKWLVTSLISDILELAADSLVSLAITIKSNPYTSILSLMGLLLAGFGAYYILKPYAFQEEGAFISTNHSSEIIEHMDKYQLSELHNSVKKIQKNVYPVEVIHCSDKGTVVEMGFCIVSQRYIIVPAHFLRERMGDPQVVIYGDESKTQKLVDHMICKVVLKSYSEDVCVLQLNDSFPAPFPKIAGSFQMDELPPNMLLFPNAAVKLEGILQKHTSIIPYDLSVGFRVKADNTNSILYKDIQYKGMCGIPTVNKIGRVTGIHTAGNGKENKGIALQWSNEILSKISELLNKESYFNLDTTFKGVSGESGIKVDIGIQNWVPKHTNFKPSPLYGVFPITRVPSNLSVNGNHTVKDVSKLSRQFVATVNNDELLFASRVMEKYLKDFDDLPMNEVIGGNDTLAPLNKKSSNGYFKYKTKEECFDFENKVMTDKFKVEFDSFMDKAENGTLNPLDVLWVETLKDEIRSVDKVLPRSFRICPVTVQVASKMCFGNMVSHIFKTRDFNQIMIGINPFTEWPKLYKKLCGKGLFAGDIKGWDKSMLPQVQKLAADIILKFYKGKYPKTAAFLLHNLAYSLVVVNDDSWILSHSMPSGSFLTAVFNSWINKIYTCMWYYRELKKAGLKPDPNGFIRDLVNLVYGDDNTNRVLNPQLYDILNAVTMRDFFQSLGMDYTDSVKGSITEKFQDISDITFLKRSFRYHADLGKIVCPLDLNTIYSGLSFIDTSKSDPDAVLQDKINCFQREIYLHLDRYHHDVEHLRNTCNSGDVLFTELPVEHMQNLYNSGKYDEYYQEKFHLIK